MERQLTTASCGHILTNTNVWSRDSRWIVYDVRSDTAGAAFDGSRIERVDVNSGTTELLYESPVGAHCGVATFSPADNRVVFILGPESAKYSANHRRGMIVDPARPGIADNLDARDITPPFTAGALRGGTHLHMFDGRGEWICFTYEDAIVNTNLRSIGVSIPRQSVRVPHSSPHHYGGDYFSVLVTRMHVDPLPGSDQIQRACEEGWVGTDGYLRRDGIRQHRAIAFAGQVVTSTSSVISELFIVDLPDDVTTAGDEPLQGTQVSLPAPPIGCVQRRLTHTQDRKYPGLQGPRHWTHSSPDGACIAFLMKDDDGITQLHTVSPNGGTLTHITDNAWGVASAFSWSKDGRQIAYVMDNSIFITDIATRQSRRLTPRTSDAPLPQACVFSPDGKWVTYVKQVCSGGDRFNQIFIATTE